MSNVLFVDVNYKSLPFQFYNNRYLPEVKEATKLQEHERCDNEKDEVNGNAEDVSPKDEYSEGFQDEDRKEYSTEGARSCETAYKEG